MPSTASTAVASGTSVPAGSTVASQSPRPMQTRVRRLSRTRRVRRRAGWQWRAAAPGRETSRGRRWPGRAGGARPPPPTPPVATARDSGNAVERCHRRDPRPAFRDGARLVERDDANGRKPLEHGAALQQQAPTCRGRQCRDHRNGCGDDECARTRDDQQHERPLDPGEPRGPGEQRRQQGHRQRRAPARSACRRPRSDPPTTAPWREPRGHAPPGARCGRLSSRWTRDSLRTSSSASPLTEPA